MDLLKATRRRGFDHDDAHDLASTAITKLLGDSSKNKNKYSDNDHVRRAAFTILRNETTDHARRKAMQLRRHVGMGDEARFLSPTNPKSAEDAVIGRETHSNLLTQILQTKNKTARQALILRAAGLNHKEVAETLGKPISTITASISKARKKFP